MLILARKTIVCKWFKLGKCKLGEHCDFLHSTRPEDLARAKAELKSLERAKKLDGSINWAAEREARAASSSFLLPPPPPPFCRLLTPPPPFLIASGARRKVRKTLAEQPNVRAFAKRRRRKPRAVDDDGSPGTSDDDEAPDSSDSKQL